MFHSPRITSFLICTALLTGCSAIDLKKQRISDMNDDKKETIKENAKIRAINVAENETFYTENLRCIGKDELLTQLPPAFDGSKNFRISVGPIYDKTAKVFPPGSTAISDLVLNALSHVGSVNVVETPLSGEITESRVNFTSSSYVFLGPSAKNQISNFAGKINHVPFGVLFPSHFFITGALIRYDEGSETNAPSIQLDLDAVNAKRAVRVITAGLHLRLISATDGEITTNLQKGTRGSVLLSSRYYKITVNASLFKIVNTSPYGFDYSVEVSDPQHYVIQEMVEKGVADLLSTFTSNDRCSTIAGRKS